MNIPGRYLYGCDDYYWPIGGPWAHSWCEVYVNGGWYHCDLTNDLFDRPWIYALIGVTIDYVRIYSCGDDGRGKWSTYDGDDYNGKLHYHSDWKYWVYYDGPNLYY